MRLLSVICALCVLPVSAAVAQQAEVAAKPVSDTDIQLLRSDVQASKNDIIAHTMQFNDTESAAFWPVYRDYARDQSAIGDKRLQLIKDYAQKIDTLDDATANDLAKRQMEIDSETTKLRSDYWPKFEKAIGAKRAAKFYQVDTRLSLLINFQLASEIPLIP